MAREIKFRAWDNEKNQYYVPTFRAYMGELEYLVLGPCGDLKLIRYDGTDHESIFPNRFIKEQSTCVKDKNGIEIYEGDILIIDTEDGPYKSVMEFVHDEGNFGSFATRLIEEMEYDEKYEGGMEVIGNIHENKELLEAYNGKTV